MSKVPKVKKIAITGMMGSGKSEASAYLFSKGYLVLNSDEIVADLYQYDEKLIRQLQALTPQSITTNNQIDKNKLKAIIFEDEALRKKVEYIVHNAVKQVLLSAFESCFQALIFVEVPLLFESGFDCLFDDIICVDIEPDLQLERLITARHFTKQQALDRLNAQFNRKQKCEKATFVVDNSSTKEALYKQLDEICGRLENDIK